MSFTLKLLITTIDNTLYVLVITL